MGGIDRRAAAKAMIGFRIAFLLVMLSSAMVLDIFYGDTWSTATVRILVSGLCFSVLSGIAYFKIPTRWVYGLVWAQVVWDIGTTSYLVSETGGLSSGFILQYSIYILLSTILLLSRGALVSSILSGLGYLAVALWSSGWEAILDPHQLSRLLFGISTLSFVGGALAYFARYRERLAATLEATKEQYRDLSDLHSAIIEHSPSGLLCIERESGLVKVMNQSAQRILGRHWLGRSLQGSSLQGFMNTGEDRVEGAMTIDGVEKVIGSQTSALPNGDLLVVFQDLTEIRSLESAMRLKEKLASVGQLAAGIAHEIRNPLASLSGSIQLLKNEMPAESGSERLMKIVLRETDRLDALIRNFLIYAKPSELQLDDVHVLKVVDEILELLKNQKLKPLDRVQLRTTISENLSIRCDGTQLKQILWNLVLNAVDAVKGDGNIEIKGEEFSKAGEPMVRLTISDSGEGIPEGIRSRIFDPFFTTKADGTGLGLSLVYQMVKAHGGQVGVESDLGKGTKFWIEFFVKGPKTAERHAA